MFNKNTIIAIGCAVAAIGSLTTLGVVYAKFQKANKAIKLNSVAAALAEQDATEEGPDTCEEAVDEVVEEPAEEIVEEPVKAPKLVKKESKSNAKSDDSASEGN